LAVAGLAAAGSASWEPYAAWTVRRTVEIPAPGKKAPDLPGADCCYVEFPTATFLQAEGADLRAAVGGEAVPFRIVDIGYGGWVRLVAAVPKKAKSLHVYYGNPEAQALKTDWHPRRGLWLETRRYLGGDCTSLRGIRQAWAQAVEERDGTGPVGRIFHGVNPFGPQDKYLSHYWGYLYMAKDATVNFAVGADDIGFVLVEGRQVAAKTNWGKMNRRKRYAGDAIRLQAGLHPIEVYHAEKDGAQNIAAAWWMGGMKRGEKYKHYQVIPASAFAPLRMGQPVDYQVRGQAIGADATYSNEGDVPLDVPNLGERMLVRYVFRDQSRPANRALQCSAHWDFGDGTTSTSRDPNHVYLRQGEYTVTLTLTRGERSWSVTHKIKAGPGYHRAGRRKWDRLENYGPIVQDYQFENMATPHVITAARIFEELEQPGEIIATCRVLYDRRESLEGPTLVRHCLLLGRHLREYAGEEDVDEEITEAERNKRLEANARKAVEVFSYAEAHTDDVKAKARLANEKGDVYLYFLDEPEAAQAEYTKILTEYNKAASDQIRLAQIRIGDVYRVKRDAKAARQAYERAAEMPVNTYSEIVRTARRGHFRRTVEDFLRRGKYEEALKALHNWEWEFPLAKLEGQASLLRARIALARENEEEAIKQCRILLSVNPDSEYADDALLFLADVHQKAGRTEQAVEAVSQLLKDYPASDLQGTAHIKRVALRLTQAQYDAAAAEALSLAERSEDSEHAPQALLLAATAHLRQKKRDEAIRTLERLRQKYPTSDEATKAIEMLKELRRP
jgi:TolA-binding protein